MAANEGVIKAVVNFYQDDSDAVFLGLSYDLRPNLLKVQILIGLLVGNVGLWPVKKFVCRRVTQDLRNGGLLEILSIAKLIKINVLLHQCLNLMFNLHYMCSFSYKSDKKYTKKFHS